LKQGASIRGFTVTNAQVVTAAELTRLYETESLAWTEMMTL